MYKQSRRSRSYFDIIGDYLDQPVILYFIQDHQSFSAWRKSTSHLVIVGDQQDQPAVLPHVQRPAKRRSEVQGQFLDHLNRPPLQDDSENETFE